MQDQGFVIDGRLGATPWRLEWGPSQRPYIQGQELRLRSELGLSPDLLGRGGIVIQALKGLLGS